MTRPLLSIVIANYNYGRFLEEAIQSVLSQGMGGQVELIICDAASTDNSVEIIKKYADGLLPNTHRTNDFQSSITKITWWCSEKDDGQSAAFNKGFSHATGRFLTWLNADDVLLPGVVRRLEIAAKQNPRCEWFVGGCLWLNPKMQVLKCVRARRFSKMRFICGHVSAWGPSCFFTKHILLDVGGVDERFHYMMDSDLWLRFASLGYRYLPLHGYAYGLRLHPSAKMSGHNFAQSDQTDRNHPKWNMLKQEAAWMRGRGNFKRITLLKRLLSMGWLPLIRGAIDSINFKGQHYARIDYMGMH